MKCLLSSLLAVLIVSLFLGCVGGKQDGDPYASAIVLDVKHQAESLPAEQAWIKRHFPQARPATVQPFTGKSETTPYFNHALVTRGNKIYDMLIIELADGSKQTLYFDITDCFGK